MIQIKPPDIRDAIYWAGTILICAAQFHAHGAWPAIQALGICLIAAVYITR